MEILVYGAGTVGSIIGWRLAQSGHRVSVVCRSSFDHIRSNGFALRTHIWADGTFIPNKVFRADAVFAKSTKKHYDYIVLANKIKSIDDTHRTINALQNLIRTEATLVSVQNGMDTEAPWRTVFANNTILSAVCNISCSQPLPGFIAQTAAIKQHAFHIGVYDHSIPSSPEDLQKLQSLVAADQQFLAVDDVNEEKWQKLVFNSAWNSLTALTGLETHELLRYPASVELVRCLAEEAFRIGTASGVKLADMLPERVIELAKHSNSITTSTLRDMRQGRKLETLHISGYLVAQAAKVDVAAPYTCMIDKRLREIDRNLVV